MSDQKHLAAVTIEAQVTARAEEMIKEGIPLLHACSLLENEFSGLPRKKVKEYFQKATRAFSMSDANIEKGRAKNMGQHLYILRDLYNQALAKKDVRTAFEIEKHIGNLLGLDPPKKKSVEQGHSTVQILQSFQGHLPHDEEEPRKQNAIPAFVTTEQAKEMDQG